MRKVKDVGEEDKGDPGLEWIHLFSLRDCELLPGSLSSSEMIWPQSLRSPRGP